MRFTTGSRLGPYEIRSVIDQGGMGEVYRACDTRLDRTVAIKVLTSARAHDRTTRLRFEREAKALSNLRHPHICALYDIGETADRLASDSQAEESIPYLVMEYLEGQTLDALLKKGPLPIDRVLRYGTEIADALHKAHRQHILHRDLKPANIMITENGSSLLDFGLAKVFSPALSQVKAVDVGSDTSTDERSLTPDGTVVGTAYYLSPEQLEGKEPDARTDIFALGICLYQMATGQRPFQGDSRAALMASILRHDPPPASTLRLDTPPSFDWVVKTCLAKDPEERFETAHDVKLELQRIAESETKPERSAPKIARLTSWAALALVTLGLAVAVVLRFKKGPGVAAASGGVRRLSIALPLQASIAAGNIEKLAVSPDGNRIAYVAAGDPPSLYLYSLEERSSKSMAETENARGPFFSPDGRWIGFSTADGFLKRVSVDGGAPTTIGRSGDVRGAAWGENDQIVFGGRWSSLKLISALNGAITVLPQQTAAGFDSRWPVFLPGGKHILYTAFDMSGNYENAQLAVFDLDARRTTVLLRGATYGRFLPPAQLIYFRSGSLFSVPFDIRTLRVTGEPVPRTSDVDHYFVSGLAQFAVASDGTLFYIPSDPAASNGELVWLDRSGRVSSISPARRAFRQPKLSPDETQILVTIDEGQNAVLWLYDIPRQTWARMAPIIGTAIWSPDGKSVAFSSNANGGVNVFIMPADGSTGPRQITHTTRWPFASSWSPDGRELAVVEQFKETLTDIYILPTDDRLPPRPLIATQFNENTPAFSPDGAWMAYQSDNTGRYEIYVTHYPEGGRRWLVSTAGGTDAEWRSDGKELFYRNGTKFMAVEVRHDSQFAVGKPHALFEGDFTGTYDVAADGTKFLMIKRDKPAPHTQINVVSGLTADSRH